MARARRAESLSLFDVEPTSSDLTGRSAVLEAPPRDVTDEPAPTVKVGVNGLCSQHFIVEGAGGGAGGLGGERAVNLGGYHVVSSEKAVDASGKPPYRVPLMSEIRTLPKNGLRIVSTFSGCGGSCLGFKMAGYEVLWASEFVPAAQETYRANHPETHLDTSDIRQVTAETIRAAIGDVEIDVLEGSPPCASFSTAGKTSKGWGKVKKYSDVEQRTDDLFEQYLRLLGELRPRAFVAENVAGMVKGVAKGHFHKYLAMFRDLPYNVEARLLDAQHLGVPQRRVRLIFVGVRKDVGRPAWPSKLPYRYSIREALPWLSKDAKVQDQYGAFTEGGKGNSTREKKTLEVDPDGPAPTIRAALSDQLRIEDGVHVVEPDYGDNPGVGRVRSIDEPLGAVTATGEKPQLQWPASRKVGLHDDVGDHVGASLDGYAVGEEWDRMKEGEQSEKYFSLLKPDSNEPSPTITAVGGPGGVAGVTHPFERRKFTIAELRRICGFPDDFVLTGTYAQRWERMGRAVPPPMMRAVAEALAPVLLRK